MRLLINKERSVDIAFPLPWRYDATCFNFKAPKRAVTSAKEIKSPQEVETLVVACDLPDYQFIGEMVNLVQLYLYAGKNIKELSFLENLVKIRQLCIYGANFESLAGLVKLVEKKSELYKEFAEKSEAEKFKGRIKYGFEAIYLQSNLYNGDGKEILMPNILRGNNACINGKYISAIF